MKKHFILLSLLLSCAPLVAQESAATTEQPAQTAPQYDSDDAALEAELTELKKEAQNGNLEAAIQIYRVYASNGSSTQPQAEAWFHRCLQLKEARAEQGSITDLRELGLLYLNGDLYLPVNPQKGVTLLSRACELGDADAAIFLARYFSTTSPTESQNFYARAYELHKAIIDTIEAGKELTPAQRESLVIIGTMEQEGIGTEKNPAAGIAHLEQADTPEAHLRLFQTYTKGIGVAVDMPKALSYAAKIADTAIDSPQNAAPSAGIMAWILADSYLNGKNGMPVDTQLGEKYLNIADSLNIVQAIYCKGLRLQSAGNHSEAYIAFSRAASMRHPEAQMHAALMQLHGAPGIEKNEEMAIEKLRQIANSYDRGQEWYVGRAPYELALYYERIGQEDLADEWYRIASDRNVVEAMAHRGLSHIRPGSAMEWSPTLMYKWWKIGSNAGDATCSRYLNIFLWGVIPAILIIVFGLPILVVHILNKRAEKRENAAE